MHGHPLGEVVSGRGVNNIDSGVRQETKANSFNEGMGRPLIPSPKVPLAQAVSSAALSFPHWHLWLDVSASAVSGCRGRP